MDMDANSNRTNRHVVVKKYGGSSLADDQRLRAVATRIAASARKPGAPAQVIVVSAMGGTTNRLLAQAGRLNADPSHRELDLLLATGEQQSASLLSLTLQQLGLRARALTGPQAGVRTCGSHLNARITEVQPQRIETELAENEVVVIAGFQGLSPGGDVTTLGRGGSDTTAVAIAAALKARACEIYSDVDGVYTADPRVVEQAARLSLLSHGEMKSMAHHGARVLNERAIDYAIKHDVVIHARCSKGRPGETLVRSIKGPGRPRIVGIAGHSSLLRIAVCDPEAWPQSNSQLAEFERFLGAPGNAAPDQVLLPAGQLPDEDGLAANLRQRFGQQIEVSADWGSVSAIGFHAGRDASNVQFACEKLDQAGIAVRQVSTGEHSVCALVPRNQVGAAMRCFHSRFKIADLGVAHVA